MSQISLRIPEYLRIMNKQRENTMESKKLEDLDVAEFEKFISECEKEASKLEITVDYYIAEFL